eukprot:363994-Chlamydomonas_euryale.AAC.8
MIPRMIPNFARRLRGTKSTRRMSAWTRLARQRCRCVYASACVCTRRFPTYCHHATRAARVAVPPGPSLWLRFWHSTQHVAVPRNLITPSCDPLQRVHTVTYRAPPAPLPSMPHASWLSPAGRHPAGPRRPRDLLCGGRRLPRPQPGGRRGIKAAGRCHRGGQERGMACQDGGARGKDEGARRVNPPQGVNPPRGVKQA